MLGRRCPFSRSPFGRAFRIRYLEPGKSRPQGLATLSATSATFIGGSLFQLPTLVGLSPQSFPPIGGSRKSFLSLLRSRAFRPNFPAWPRRLSDFISTGEPSSFFAPRFFTPGRRLMLSRAFCDPSGFPSGWPRRNSLFFFCPSHPSTHTCLRT